MRCLREALCLAEEFRERVLTCECGEKITAIDPSDVGARAKRLRFPRARWRHRGGCGRAAGYAAAHRARPRQGPRTRGGGGEELAGAGGPAGGGDPREDHRAGLVAPRASTGAAMAAQMSVVGIVLGIVAISIGLTLTAKAMGSDLESPQAIALKAAGLAAFAGTIAMLCMRVDQNAGMIARGRPRTPGRGGDLFHRVVLAIENGPDGGVDGGRHRGGGAGRVIRGDRAVAAEGHGTARSVRDRDPAKPGGLAPRVLFAALPLTRIAQVDPRRPVRRGALREMRLRPAQRRPTAARSAAQRPAGNAPGVIASSFVLPNVRSEAFGHVLSWADVRVRARV